MKFLKAHNLGNDFIIVDSTETTGLELAELATKLCNRHTGIGADGLLVYAPSDKADAYMHIINADGSVAQMCGNGISCFATYLAAHKLLRPPQVTIETRAGVINLELEMAQEQILTTKVNLGMPQYHANPSHLTLLQNRYELISVLLGVPHTIIFVKAFDMELLGKLAPLIAKDPLFPEGTNVNFVKVNNSAEVEVVTWERGVGFSLACGTGAGAVAVAGSLAGKTQRNLVINFAHGPVRATWHQSGSVVLTGLAAQLVCYGEVLV